MTTVTVKSSLSLLNFFTQLVKSKKHRQGVIDEFTKVYDKPGFKFVRVHFPIFGKNTKDNPASFKIIPDKFSPPDADPSMFMEYMKKGQQVVKFPSLSGKTILICPTPNKHSKHNGHIMEFMVHGDEDQKHELLKEIGKTMLEFQNSDGVFLHTLGYDVPWLHVRISYPK